MDTRRVEVDRNGVWEPIQFSDLKKGDTFKLYEPGSDELVGGKPLTAETDAFKDQEKGVYSVLCIN